MDLLAVHSCHEFLLLSSDRSVRYPRNRLIDASASATLFGTSALRLKLLWPSGRPGSVAVHAYDVRFRRRIEMDEYFVALESCLRSSASRRLLLETKT